MEKLYLKQEAPRVRGEVTFFDVHENEIYHSRGSFMPMPQKCCAGALPPIPKEYELTDANDQAVVRILRTSSILTPEFEVMNLIAGVPICKTRKKSRITKATVVITTEQGNYLVDGSIWHHEFDILNEQGIKIINMQKKSLVWGDTYEITIDSSQINVHSAAGIVLAVDCTYHSGN